MPRHHASKRKSRHSKPTVSHLAHQMAAMKMLARKPLKYYEYPDTVVNWMAAGTGQLTSFSYLLNEITEGTTVTQRVGDKVKNRFIRIKVGLTQNISAPTTATQTMIRIVLLIKKQTDNAIPNAPVATNSSTYLAEAGEPAMDPANVILSPKNPNISRFYTVLHDKVYTPDTNSDTRTMTVNINKRLNLNTVYQQGAGAIVSDITTGELWLVFYRSITTPDVTLSLLTEFNSRLYFTD